jgi:hypothetical protein
MQYNGLWKNQLLFLHPKYDPLALEIRELEQHLSPELDYSQLNAFPPRPMQEEPLNATCSRHGGLAKF